ncbi:ribosome maturation factor RimP [Christensenella intestinihominis]|uniref:ribosome maturation factor RimP n=1 Tax=Christensenella intestinihominis TaxID=1851429 RepID=UPI00082CB8F9|nr:ribosome maturation factor RimP [Christensenella intestinihominis]
MAKNTRTIVEEIAMPIVEALGFQYVDTEYAKQGQDWLLTVYIDKDGGVLIDDCETASRAIEAVLDEKDLIAESYILCVSSPGLDRPLKNERDFARCMGSEIDIKLYKPFQGKKEYTGVLTAYTPSSITVETDENEITFDCKETAKISLHLDF